MALKDLFSKGQKAFEDRGGVGALKEDAKELKNIATGKGSIGDKAKDAVAAVKDPGAKDPDAPETPAAAAPETPAAEVPEPAEPPAPPTAPETPQAAPPESPAQDIAPPAAVPPGGESS